MSSTKKEIIKESLAFLTDAARNVTDERINDAVNKANEEGIAITAAALYEARVEDTVIINLLRKHWNIDEDDATEVLRYERTVKCPSRALKAYLTGQGLNPRDIRGFMIKTKVVIKLSHDPSLWKLTPAELIDAVKENE